MKVVESKTKKQLLEESGTLRRRVAEPQNLRSRRKQMDKTLPIIHHFLKIANQSLDMTSLLEEFVSAIRNFTGCEAVGIRMLDKEGNIHYQTYKGFSQRFYELESPLSIKSDQCMCINIIKGTTQAKLPYYTKGGSFYTNGTTRFLATVPEEEKGQTRNICNQFGYESVALIPICVEGRILGLIHIADRQEDMVPLEKVQVMEEVAMPLGMAIQRVLAEEELRESEERYRHLFEQAPIGIGVASLDGKVLNGNKAVEVTTGYSINELKRINLADIYENPEDRKALLAELSRDGSIINYQTRFKRKDGTLFDVLLNISRVHFQGEDVLQTTITDITERKKIEEEIIRTRAKVETLRVSGKMKTQLLSLVSHELRTPLASIRGFANTLLQSDVKWSEEEKTDFIQEIDREADRLTRIVGDLLDMTYLEAGVLSLNRGKYKLHKVLESASDMLTKITEHHQLQLKVPEESPFVFVDQERIIQVLTNLVENAVKFSKKSSQITIEASLDSDEIIVAVTDEGIGIPYKLLGKIFDRFYQVKALVTGHKKGTGLGLSICRGIIAAHGGSIWVKSKAGKGSKFSFSLPVAKDSDT